MTETGENHLNSRRLEQHKLETMDRLLSRIDLGLKENWAAAPIADTAKAYALLAGTVTAT